MISYVVPKSLYRKGYHVKPHPPLSFLSLPSQKNYILLYHMGIYMLPTLLECFTEEYAKTGSKLEMGKSCIVFKQISNIPYELIGKLASKIEVNEWIRLYEKS